MAEERIELPTSGEESTDELKERLLAELIDGRNRGDETGEERLRAEHPLIAEEVLELFRAYDRIGRNDEKPLGVLGDYRLVRRLGRGGMGIVYEAWQGSMERRIAIKVLPGGLLADLKTVARFEREARIAGKLQHPNIVSVHGIGVDDNTPYYVMEFVEGETLSRIIERLRDQGRPAPGEAVSATASGGSARRGSSSRERPPVLAALSRIFGKNGDRSTEHDSGASPPPEPPGADGVGRAGEGVDARYAFTVAEAFAGAAEGLQSAHAQAIIHRDLKPSNLMLDKRGRLRILDFGLARIEGQESLTDTGDFVGTPLYMSPEQVRARKSRIDHRTDIYSLGATLYEMLTLRPPFRGKSNQDTLTQITTRDPDPPRAVNFRIPRELETIVLKCLRKDPGERYGTAEALAQDLRRFVRGDPIEARPQARWERLIRRAWRQRARIAAGACALLLLVTTGLLLVKHSRELETRTTSDYERMVNDAALELEWRKLSMGAWSREPAKSHSWDGVASMDFDRASAEPSATSVERAVKRLEEAARLLPRRLDAFFHRARGLQSLGRLDEAGHELDTVLAIDATFIPARMLKRVIAGAAPGGGPPGGEPAGLAPGAPEWAADWVAAQEALSAKRWDEAAGAYEKLIEMSRRGGEPYLGAAIEFRLGRGHALLEKGDLNGAVLEFGAASDRWPEALEPALLLGKAWHLKGERAQAESTFERIFARVTSGEKSDELAVWISNVHGRLKDFEKALLWAEKLSPGALRERLRASCLHRLDRLEESTAAYREWLRLEPSSWKALTSLGWVLWTRGKNEEALECFRKALELEPGDQWARNNTGIALELLGKVDEAHAMWRSMIADDPKFKAPYYNLGLFTLARGKIDEGVDVYRSVLAVDPDSGYSMQMLGHALVHRGRLDEAIDLLRRSVPLRKDVMAFLALGMALERKGSPREALAEYVNGLELSPRSTQVHRNIARLLRDRSQRELGPEMKRLLKLLDRIVMADVDLPMLPQVLASTAVALSRDPASRESVSMALRYGLLGVERSRRREAAPLAALASVRSANGEEEKAILGLEEALLLPGADLFMERMLAEHRNAVAPDLPSVASLEASLNALDSVTLLSGGSPARFSAPSEDEEDWRTAGFDDSAWSEGALPLSSASLDDGSSRISDLRSGARIEPTPGTSLRIRASFEIADPSSLASVELGVQAASGYAVWLNGSEVARHVADLEEVRLPFPFALRPRVLLHRHRVPASLLAAGANVLALEVLPAPGEKPDLLAAAFLEGRTAAPAAPATGTGGQVFRGPERRAQAMRWHLEGRLLERRGDLRAAAESLARSAAAQPGEPLTALALARCLHALGDPSGARAALRRALDEGSARREVWESWAARGLEGGRSAAEALLEDLPRRPEPERPPGGTRQPPSPAEDIGWLLEKVRDGEAIRIDCGGDEHVSEDGTSWSRDRFHIGGNLEDGPSPFRSGIALTNDDALYQTVRWFGAEEPLPGSYRIPLPPGRYRVVVHLAEISDRVPGRRRFDVEIEGKPALTGIEPLSAGFAAAGKESVDVELTDGLLDIVPIHRAGQPGFAALEVIPLEVP